MLAVSIRQKQLLRHEEEDGEDMEVEEDKIEGKVGRGQKVEGVEMTEGGGQRRKCWKRRSSGRAEIETEEKYWRTKRRS